MNIKGIEYGEKPTYIKEVGAATVRVFEPLTHNIEEAKKNRNNLNMICSEILQMNNIGHVAE